MYTADDYAREEIKDDKGNGLRLAQVTSLNNDVPCLTFFGEEVESQKKYTFLASYVPTVGDIVCVARVNESWLILGKVNDRESEIYNHYSLVNPYGGELKLLYYTDSGGYYTFRFEGDGKMDVGTSSNRCRNIYATTGTIQTSDARKKENVKELEAKYFDFFMELLPKRYSLIDGTSGRAHIGFLAQDVEIAMEKCGIISAEFAGFVKSPVYGTKGDRETEEVIDYVYGLRYEEFVGILTYVLQDAVLFLKERGYRNE